MRRIKGLDGLRGISVLLVIFSHGLVWDRIGVDSEWTRRALSANVGVSVFFVLSGFLITLLLIEERRRTGTISIRNFYVRRTLRIFPLYFLAVSFVLLVHLMGLIHLAPCTIAYAYTYLVNLAPNDCSFSSYSHFWSLSVEEHFYLIWPTLFLLPPAAVVFVSAIFILGAHALGTSLFASFAGMYEIGRWTFPAATPIVYGCLAAFVASSPNVHTMLPKWWENVLLYVAVVAFIFAGHGAPSFVLYGSITIVVLFIYRHQGSALTRVLEWAPLAYIGLISYGLYVWQGVFTGNGPYRDFASFPPPLDVGLLITAIVAPLSYAFFERPILRLKSRWRSDPVTSREPRREQLPTYADTATDELRSAGTDEMK